MSWASHEWKDGLPLKALHNIEELEKQRDRLRKELQQRQLQIETMEQVNTKQKQKFDVERMAHSALATDNKILMEQCEQLEKKRHRLEHELQMKEAQLLNMEDAYHQTKKQLEAEAHKSLGLERQLDRLEGMVRSVEIQEKRSASTIKMVKDMLQDQHWHDIAQISAEKDLSGQLKVDLMRVQNEFIKHKFDIKDNGNPSLDMRSNYQSGDSGELMKLREKVAELTNELMIKDQQCQSVVVERDALKAKFTDTLLGHQQQLAELTEKLRTLQAEHKGIVEQCSHQTSSHTDVLSWIGEQKQPLPPWKTQHSPVAQSSFTRPQGSNLPVARSKSVTSNMSAEVKKSMMELQESLTTVKKLRWELDEFQKKNMRLIHEKTYLVKENTKLELATIHLEAQLIRLSQTSMPGDQPRADTNIEVELKAIKGKYRRLVDATADSAEQQKELTATLQHNQKQVIERNTELQRQLNEAHLKADTKKRQNTAEKRRLELLVRELKAEVATLKRKLSDYEILNEKYKRDIVEKRKSYTAEIQSLTNKLKKVTMTRDELLDDLNEMTTRWKNLEQQVSSKVELLAMFGEKLEVAESVATDLESKFEVKTKTVEAEQEQVESLKSYLENTQMSLQDVTRKYNNLKVDYENVCKKIGGSKGAKPLGYMKPDHRGPHESQRYEAASNAGGKNIGGSPWEKGQKKDRQLEELSDKLARAEASVTQLKSKVNQLQDMNINGEMLINKKQQLVRKLEDQAKQDNSQMVDLQRVINRQEDQLQDKEKALTALRERLSLLESQVTRQKDGVAQCTAKVAQEHQALADAVKTLQTDAANHEATVKDLRMQLENSQRLLQTQTELCKKLEKEKETLEKSSGLLGNEKQTIDSKMQELAAELASVKEKASAMEVQQKQKLSMLNAEIVTLRKELSESVTLCDHQSEKENTQHTEAEERKLNEQLLLEQLKQQKDSVDKLSVMVKVAEQERAKLASELQVARDESTAASSEQTKLKCSSDSLINKLKGRVEALETDKSTLQCQLGELGINLDRKDCDIQHLTDAQLELTSKNDQLVQELSRLKDTDHQLQVEIEQLKKACEERSARVIALETQLSEGNLDWARKLEQTEDIVAALREKLRVSDIENDSLKMELSVTGRELEKRDGDRRVAEAKVVDLLATSETLRQQIATGREEKEKLDGDVQELRLASDEMGGKLEMCEKELANVKGQQIETGNKLEALVASLKEQLNAAKDETTALQQELKQAMLKLDGNDESAVATARHMSQYKEQNEQLLQQIEESKHSMEQLKLLLSSAEEEKGKIVAKLDDANDQLNAEKTAKEKLQCESTGLVEDLRKRQKQGEEEIAALRMELENAMTKLECNEGISTVTMQELSQCKEHNEQLLQQIQESKNAVEQLKSVLYSLEEEKRKIAAKLDDANDQLNAEKSAKEKLQCESTGIVEDFRKRQKQGEEEIAALRMELENAMTKLECNEGTSNVTMQELSQCKEHSEQLLQRIQESQNAMDQLQSVITNLEKENANVVVKLEEAEDELKTVKDEKDKLQCETTGLIDDLRKRQKEEEGRRICLHTELLDAMTKLDNKEGSIVSSMCELSQSKEANEQLLQQIEESKSVANHFKSILSSLEEEKQKIIVELESTKDELSAVKGIGEKLQCESIGLIEDLRKRQRETEDEKMTLKKELGEALTQLDSNKDSAAPIVQELSQCKEHNEQLLQQIQESKNAVEQLKSVLYSLEEEKGKIAAKLDDATNELDTVKRSKEKLHCVSTGLVEELQRRLKEAEDKKAVLNSELDEALAKVDSSEESAASIVQELSQSKEHNAQLLQQNGESKDALDSLQLKLALSEEESEKLSMELETVKGKLWSRSQEQESQQSQSAELIADLKEQCMAAEYKTVALQKDLQDVVLKLDNGQEVMSGVVHELEVAREREAALLQQQEQLKQQLVAMETATVERDGEKAALAARCDQLQVELKGGQAEEVESRTKQEALIAELRERVSAAKAERDAMKNDVDAVTFKFENLTEDLESLSEQLAESTAHQSQLEQHCAELKASLSDVERSLEETETEKCAALAAVEQLRVTIDSLTAEVAAKQTEVENVETRVRQNITQQQQEALLTANNELNQLQVVLTAQEEHCNNLQQEKSDLANDLDAAKRQVGHLEGEKMELLGSVDRLEAVITASTASIDELRQKISTAEEMKVALTAKHADQTHSAEKAQADARKHIEELQLKLHVLDVEDTDAKAKHAQIEIDLESCIEQLRADIASCRTENDWLLAQLKELEFQLATTDQEKVTLQSVGEQREIDLTVVVETHAADLTHRDKMEADLHAKLSGLHAELGKCEEDLARSRELVSELEQQLLTAKEPSSSTSTQYNMECISKLETAVSELEQQLQEATEQADKRETQIGVLHGSVSALEGALATKELRHTCELDDCVSKIKQLANEVNEKQAVVDRVQEKLDVTLATIDDKAMTVQSKSADLSRAQHEMEQKSLEQQRQNESQLAELQAQLEFATNMAQSEKVALQGELSAVRDQLNETKDAIHASDVKHSRTTAEYEAEVSQLTMSVEHLQQQATVSEQQLSAVKLEVSSRTDELFAATERIRSLMEESNHLGSASQQDLVCARDKLQQAEASLIATEAKLSAANEDKSALEQKLSEAVTAQAQLHQQIVSLEGSTAQTAIERGEQLALIENLRQQVEDAHTSTETQSSRLNRLVQDLELQLSQISDKETERFDRCRTMESTLAANEEKLTAAKSRLVQLEEKLSESGATGTQLHEQVATFKEQMRMQEEEQVTALADMSEKYDRATEQYNCDITNLRQAITTLEKRLQEKQGELDDQHELVQELEMMLQDLRTSAAEEKCQVEAECNELREQLRTLEDVDSVTVSYAASLQSDVEERCEALLSENEDMQKERNDLANNVVDLNEKVMALQNHMKADTERYNDELSSHVAEVASLKEKLSCLEDKNESASAEIDGLLNKMQCQGDSEASLMQKIHGLEKDKMAAMNEVNILNENILSLKGDTESVVAEVSQLKESILQLEVDKRSLQTETLTLEEKIDQLCDQIATEQETSAALAEKTAELVQQNEQLAMEVEQLHVSLELACSDSSEERPCSTCKLDAENVELAKGLTAGKKNETNMKIVLASSEAENLKVVDESDALVDTEGGGDILAVENTELQEKFIDVNKQVSDLTAKVVVAEVMVMELSEKVESLRAEKEGWVEQLSRLENEKLLVAKNLDAANAEISALTSEVECARTAAEVSQEENTRLLNQVESKQMECGALAEQLQEMRDQLEWLTEQKSQFCEQMCELQSHLSVITNDRDTAVSQYESVQAEHLVLQQAFTQVDTEHEQLLNTVEQLRSSTERLEREKSEAELKTEETEELVQVIQVEAEGFQAELDECRRMSCDLQASLDSLQAERDSAISAAAGHQEVLARRDVEMAALQKELSDTEVDWESKSREIDVLGKTVGRMEREADETEREMRGLEEKCEAAITANDDCLAELESARAQCSSLMEQVRQLEASSTTHAESVHALTADNESLQRKLTQQTAVTQQLADAQHDMDTLRQEVVTLKQQVSNEQTRDETKLLECAQAELTVLKKELVEASRRLRVKDESDTQTTSDDKEDLERKRKEAEVWRSRYHSLIQRYQLLEQENDTLKDKLEGPVIAKPLRRRICTGQNASAKRSSHMQLSGQAKKMCHKIILDTATTGENREGHKGVAVGRHPTKATNTQIKTKLSKEQTSEASTATQLGKQICRIATVKPESAGVGHATSLNAKALAVITNSPKKGARPANGTKTGTKSTTPVSSPATKCLSLKKTPERLSRRRLEGPTKTSDDNPENCEVQ